jgi:hypothetical protein
MVRGREFLNHIVVDNVLLKSYLNENVAAPVLKTEINGRGDPLR